MPIQQENIKFLESQVMDDVPEGGGAATGNQIIDGNMNNVFEDISDTDRAYGRFNLRKLFLGVRSLDTSLFGGAKTVITALPEDETIGYALFDTGSPFDTREEAANKVEAYLYKSTTWAGYLNENHISGMTAISVIQKVGSSLPPIGKTLCLVQNEGMPDQKEQYVRVIDVSTADAVFTDDKGEFTRMIVTLTLSDALRFNFAGHTVSRFDSEYTYTNKTRIRDTRVADATRYYSAQKLDEAASVGDLTIKTPSIFTQLVPSAQTETPLVNKTLSPTVAQLIDLLPAPFTSDINITAIGSGVLLTLQRAIAPSSLTIMRTSPSFTFSDDGLGGLQNGSGVIIGSVIYETGEILFNENAPTYASGATTVGYMPVAIGSQQAHTKAIGVTEENRRLNWAETLLPIPEKKTLVVSYMALGNWYVMQDDGNGIIAGSDPSIGAGTISYVTGAMLISLGALPDAGSSIILSYGSGVHYVSRVGDINVSTQKEMRFSIGHSIKPGTFALSWTSGVDEKTATADAHGIISGDADGFINYSSGDFAITTAFPADEDGFHVEAKQQTQVTAIKTGVSESGGIATINLGEAILAGSLRCEWDTVSTTKKDSSTTVYKYTIELV